MSYKEKLEEAEHKAHYKNIATKILRDLSVLRNNSENSPTMRRRWIWELIQNAKDVYGEHGVKIEVEFIQQTNNTYIKFSHNGKPFSADNIRFLIEQVSSKDRDNLDDETPKTTGKFGTGFLTTHLLSEIVWIDGVAKEPKLDYRKFRLKLDRSGSDIETITKSVKDSKDSILDLDTREPFLNYVEGEFNTIFYYELKDQFGIDVANAGINDLRTSLPYCLNFVPQIAIVDISPKFRFQRAAQYSQYLGDNNHIVWTQVTSNGNTLFYPSVKTSKNDTTILVPVIVNDDGGISLRKIPDNVPRLFCSFPLLGTENFSFPVIVNNPRFNPTDPRDGIFLNTPPRAAELSNENKQIMLEAMSLYFSLLDFAIKNNWLNIHILADFNLSPPMADWIDRAWFKTNISDPLMDKLLSSRIVCTQKIELCQIILEGKPNVYFPFSTKKEIREEIWNVASYCFNYKLPRREDIELWYNLKWSQFSKLDTALFAEFLSLRKNVLSLTEVLQNINVFDWLNRFYTLIILEESTYDSIVNKHAIFPNQNGDFVLMTTIFLETEDIPEVFKEILNLLGKDIKKTLLDRRILNDQLIQNRNYSISDAVKQITQEVNDKTNSRDIAKQYYPAFKLLLTWFEENEAMALEWFPSLYQRKHVLYNDQEIMENIKAKKEIDSLLYDLNIGSIQELKAKIHLEENPNRLLPVTQDILMSMGITNIGEWQEAIKDKNLAELFSHESTPTSDMFIYAQSLIAQAQEAIIAHLSTLPEYNLSQAENTAPTVIAGVLKNGQQISIVIRPAYRNEVIVYYGSERLVLEFEPSELWVDDGTQVRQITLGHVLNKGRITKFPI